MSEVDPEVEWLAARLLGDHMAPDATEPWASLPDYIHETWRAPARTALAILRERYILVPRDGAEEEAEWGEQSPRSGRIYGGASEEAVRLNAEIYAEGPDSGWAIMRRRVVYGPWEPAPSQVTIGFTDRSE